MTTEQMKSNLVDFLTGCLTDHQQPQLIDAKRLAEELHFDSTRAAIDFVECHREHFKAMGFAVMASWESGREAFIIGAAIKKGMGNDAT